MVLSRSYSLYSGEHFLLWVPIHPLCAFSITQCSSCLSWGNVQGVSWGSFLSIFVIFIFWYSPTLHLRDFHVRYYRTPPSYWERTVSVCIMTLYSVFVLCVFPPPFSYLFLMHTSCVFFLFIHACTPMCYIIPRHPFGGIYIWRVIYIWRNISIWRALSVLSAPSSFFPPSSFSFFPSSKDLITLTLRYQLRH